MVDVAVLGLGYVGTVTAACFAAHGHKVVGVDTNPAKVQMLADGTSPISEPGLDSLVRAAISRDLLGATTDPQEAVRASDVSFITVGTPSRQNADVDLSAVRQVLTQIGLALRDHQDFHTIVLRSTVPPGTTSRLAVRVLADTSGKIPGRDFQLFFNPEFLREGHGVDDFYDPPYVVIGRVPGLGDDSLRQLWTTLPITAPIIELTATEAEMLKYASNAFHALKVVFANEVGAICKSLDVDGQRLMDVFVQDSRLNTSGSYLMPGFAFGGSCLPKDVDALDYLGKTLDLRLPVLNSIRRSNELQIARAAEMVLNTQKRRVAIIGLSFKEGTDDVRNSPAVLLAERLIGKGREVAVFDRQVVPEYLLGRNKEFLEARLPHITRLLKYSPEQCIDGAEVVVLCARDTQAEQILTGDGSKIVIDLVGVTGLKGREANYSGIAW
jgi:GDP-mannose 6-dehydrogenase